MIDLEFITLADLLNEISERELVMLSHLDDDQEIAHREISQVSLNESVIEDANRDAVDYIRSYVDVSNPTRLLRGICANLTIINLRKKHNYPVDTYEFDLSRIDSLLLKMSQGKISVNVADVAEKQKKTIRKFIIRTKKIDWS